MVQLLWKHLPRPFFTGVGRYWERDNTRSLGTAFKGEMPQFLLFWLFIYPNSQTWALLCRGPSPGSEAGEVSGGCCLMPENRAPRADSTMPRQCPGRKAGSAPTPLTFGHFPFGVVFPHPFFPCAFHPVSVHCLPHGHHLSLGRRGEEPSPCWGKEVLPLACDPTAACSPAQAPGTELLFNRCRHALFCSGRHVPRVSPFSCGALAAGGQKGWSKRQAESDPGAGTHGDHA